MSDLKERLFLNPDAEGTAQHLPVAVLQVLGGVPLKVQVMIDFFRQVCITANTG